MSTTFNLRLDLCEAFAKQLYTSILKSSNLQAVAFVFNIDRCLLLPFEQNFVQTSHDADLKCKQLEELTLAKDTLLGSPVHRWFSIIVTANKEATYFSSDRLEDISWSDCDWSDLELPKPAKSLNEQLHILKESYSQSSFVSNLNIDK